MILKGKQFTATEKPVAVDVPASKSILNRALVLAALSEHETLLKCGSLCEDTRALLGCLHALGIRTEITNGTIAVHGCGGNIPDRNAELNVMSAGTAARFLPSVLAFCGGDYLFTASEQMQKRPMGFLSTLGRLGADITYLGDPKSFPFRLRSAGIVANEIEIDTDISTQYASGLLLAASAAKSPVTLILKGARTQGSYLMMTVDLLQTFGIKTQRSGDRITVYRARKAPAAFTVEGDMSGACYFCALALLRSCKTLVRNVRKDGLQGDGKFLKLLEEKGLELTQLPEGLLADGSKVTSFTGFDCDFRDFSDQTATAAVLAPFASTPSRLHNIGHIRFQECDRVAAIVNNINALGGIARAEGDDIAVEPVPLAGGRVTTCGDHRIAMAFALAGTRTERVELDDPDCVKKTFEDFFDQLNKFF